MSENIWNDTALCPGRRGIQAPTQRPPILAAGGPIKSDTYCQVRLPQQKAGHHGQEPVNSPHFPCLQRENRGAQTHTWASRPPLSCPGALLSDLPLTFGTSSRPNRSAPKTRTEPSLHSERPPTLTWAAQRQSRLICQKIKSNVSQRTINAICQQGVKAR